MNLPEELVAFALKDRVGILTYIAARQVCKTWASACLDEQLLIAVAEYTGGLTRTQLQHLLHLNYDQVKFYRSIEISRSALYRCIYVSETVGNVMRQLGGIAAIHHRPQQPTPTHDELVWFGSSYTQNGADVVPEYRTAREREELLHRAHICREARLEACRQEVQRRRAEGGTARTTASR